MSNPNRMLVSRRPDHRARKVALLAPAPSLALALAYCLGVLDLGRSEASVLAGSLAAYAIVFAVVAMVRLRAVLPVGDGADGAAHADRSSILAAPRRMQWTCVALGLGAIAFVPASMASMGFESWIGLDRLRSLASIGLVGSMVGGFLVFHWMRDVLAEARASFGPEPAAMVAHGDRPGGASLRRKLSIAIGLPAVASILLIVDVMQVNARTFATTQGLDWAEKALSVIAQEDASLPLSVRVVGALPRPEFWPVPLELSQLTPHRAAAAERPDPLRERIDREIGRGIGAGSIVPESGPEIGAFRTLASGRVLVARVQRADLDVFTNPLDGMVGIVCLGLIGLAFTVGHLFSTELRRGVTALDAAMLRWVGGDLAEPVGYDSEDELGALGRRLESVREIFRSTIERHARAADRAERAVEGASSALAEVSSTTISQTELLRHVSQMMGMIVARVDEAAHSAEDLNRTIEESGSSLLELGATGDELNNTAAVLTSKVEAVSESLEHMVASVKQITGTTDKLSSASEDTSSSMEEMASAMRAVDISAETTANLSHEVVSKAELGQAKVVQTIEGMEAIREATEIAERVIRGLGARTNEIGGILDVIDDVTDETNLLALNAAIIAAQAGEQGKAFSVVADEIKELADRVLASTKEIGGLIRAVQDESENAIGAIEAGSSSVMSGVDLSAEAGRTLEEITVASRESGTRIAEIVSSVREQTTAASHVVRLMERVRESAEEISAAGAEQGQGNEVVYQLAQAMREVAFQVRRTTEEQARGFSRIRDNVVGVREAVEQITGSLGDQSGACKQVAESLERVSKGTQASETAAEKVREAIRELAVQAEGLREDARRFRI